MKRKILGIPVMVIVCILGIILASGIAYAAVNLFAGGQATVAVSESVTVEAGTPDPGVWVAETNTWVLVEDPSDTSLLVYPNTVGTLDLTLTAAEDSPPVVVTVAAIPTLFPGSNYLDDGVSMTISYTSLETDTAVQTSGGLTLTMDSAETVGPAEAILTLTFTASNSAVAGNYAYTISISR
jgi:hypothetical protein